MSNDSSNRIPAWYTQYYRSFIASEAHGFILYGDFYGLAYENISHRGFLIAELAKRRSIIVSYDMARGIQFADPSMREAALTLLQMSEDGEEEADEPAAPDPFQKALAGIGNDEAQAPEDPFAVTKPIQALRLLEKLMRKGDKEYRGKVAVIIEYADGFLSPLDKGTMQPDIATALILLQTWARDSALGARNNPFFLVVQNLSDLHPDIRRSSTRYKAVEIALPNLEEREAYISWYLQQRQERGRPIRLVDIQAEELPRLTAGLSLRNIEDILLLGAKSEGVTRLLVKANKDAIITSENSEIAEMLDPLSGGFNDLGGMEKLIAWSKANLIEPIRSGDVQDVPKGILLVGPPGSGKTYFVRALASEVGFNAVALNIENILGSYVGESEKQLAQFFKFCIQMAPVLVFMDELDQSDVSQRGNGSGNPVAKNLFSAMLRIMGDETLIGKIIFVFASNRPDLIDSALKRPGRIDETIPVRLPNEAARYGIIQAQARTQNIQIEEEAARFMAAKTPKYSAAALTKIIKKARKLTLGQTDRIITVQEATRAIKTTKLQDADLADWYTLLAVNACTDTDLLEEDEAELKADPKALQKRLKAAKPLEEPEEREERS
jgi:AAA+ superfamily predicted ATPase